MRVEGVTRVATGDVQVPEVIAGLDICFLAAFLEAPR